VSGQRVFSYLSFLSASTATFLVYHSVKTHPVFLGICLIGFIPAAHIHIADAFLQADNEPEQMVYLKRKPAG